jgi:ABC-type lipoprotein release transport system permease subunit
MIASARVLVLMSLRSLLSHKVKTLIVGAIMASGTCLLVMGTAILDSIETSMSQSIVSSLAGHLQVYSAGAKDDLALFGGIGLGSEDIGEIQNYAEVRGPLASVPNVKATVPMGIMVSVLNATGDLDRELEALRAAITAGDAEARDACIARVRHIVTLVKQEALRAAAIARDPEGRAERVALLDKALADKFWADFLDDPASSLQWLDAKIAPLAPEGRILYMRLLGTDVPLFTRTFDRLKVIDGRAMKAGERGVLLSRTFYEKQAKDKAARDLDALHEYVVDKGRSIDREKAAQDSVDRLRRQSNTLAGKIDPAAVPKVVAALRRRLEAPDDAGLSDLVERLLTLNDENIRRHRDIFYEVVAPRMDQLYAVSVGETLTLRVVSKSGYFNAVNAKVYGVYEFQGLEDADIAGSVNIIDFVTFRELYGQVTDEQRKEMEAIRTDVGVDELDREDAENVLFGGGDALVVEDDSQGGFDEFAGLDLGAGDGGAAAATPFTQREVDNGMVLNIAVILEDERLLAETQAEVAVVAEGLGLQVVDWRSAAGIIGQFLTVTRAVLWIAIFIIFLVALVIINNSMVMATIERTGEIGTMRAIGAQRGFVLTMFLVETFVLGAVAGLVGAALGAGAVMALGSVGIPAVEDILVLLFAGPRLYPTVDLSHVAIAIGVIFLVSVASTLYPAWIATRIQPVVAMQRKD